MRMRDWLTKWGLNVLLGGIVASVSLRLRQMRKRNKALGAGIEALLRDRIVQAYNHYNDKGYWPIYARDAVLGMYEQYTALGGNGTVSHLIDKLKDLPTDKRKDEIS